MLVLQGCAKEPSEENVAPSVTPVIGEQFMPEPDDVKALIAEAEERRLSYLQGSRDCSTEEPLQEAIWIAEALSNYAKGDASRYGDSWITGTVNYSFPVVIRTDGTYWVRECDLFASYESAMDQVEIDAGGERVYTLDHAFISLENGIANMQIEWSDRDYYGIAGPYEPLNSGCHDVDVAASMLTSLLHWEYHSIMPELPSFYTTLYPVEPPWWATIYTNDPVEPNNYGYVGYLGTTEAQGGAGLLFNGNDFTNSVCFPDQWNKMVLARQIVANHIGLEPPYVFVRERVVWDGFNTGQIGIPLYPVGFYHHYFEYKVGLLVPG